MKITCPINSQKEIPALAKAGADEFYFGFLSNKWKKRYSLIASPNRRYFPESNFKNTTDVKEAIEAAHSLKKHIFFAANSPYYSEKQLNAVLKDINKVEKYGADALIVSDLSLLLTLNRLNKNMELILSTGGTVFNSETADFYKNLGIKRIVLPRHLKIDEINEITKKSKGLEFESFMCYDLCRNVDGFCTFHHGTEEVLGVDQICHLYNKYELIEDLPEAQKRIINNRIKNLELNSFCAACKINELKKAGINYIKIVGRRFPTEKKIEAIKLIKNSLNKNPDEIKELFQEIYGIRCPKNCNFY